MHPVTHRLAHVATNLGLIADTWSRWSIFDSDRYEQLHAALVAQLPERDALPLREIDARDASRAAVVDLSDDYTRPIVVRGALRGRSCLEQWGDRQWWLEHYADELVLCNDSDRSYMLPLGEALARTDIYVSGTASIFQRRPELCEMVDNQLTRSLTPGNPGDEPIFHQLFMGHPKQGTTVHCAGSINLFRHICGRKRWYFIPPDQTPYVRPKIFANGYAGTSHTVQPHGDEPGSAWFGRLKRYTVVLEPGDLMINPPWWWHAVENLPDDGLVAGVPTRFLAGARILRIDAFKTALAISRVLTQKGTGIKAGAQQDPVAYEESLLANRAETGHQVLLNTQ